MKAKRPGRACRWGGRRPAHREETKLNLEKVLAHALAAAGGKRRPALFRQTASCCAKRCALRGRPCWNRFLWRSWASSTPSWSAGWARAAIAAVGLTTQPKFICLAVFLSLNVAVSALVARRRGQDDPEKANRVLVQSILITLGLTAIISAAAFVFAEPILRLAGSAPDTHEDAVAYFRIITAGMVFNTLTMVINAAQRGAGNTRIAMKTNIVANLVNICFNYLLIGGNLGFPKLGVSGAAIATVLGTVVACVMSFRSVLRHGSFVSLRGRLRISFDRETMRAILNIGSSTLAEQLFLRIGFLTYSIVVANLGTVAFAAHQVGMNVMSISFSFGDGLSVAGGCARGAQPGRKAEGPGAESTAACASAWACSSRFCSPSSFSRSAGRSSCCFPPKPRCWGYGDMIMRVLVVVVFLQISQVVFTGCLRGAGDARYTALVSLVSVAFIRPFSGWLLCYPLGLGLLGAWLGLAIDQFMRFLMTYIRFRKGKWVNLKI